MKLHLDNPDLVVVLESGAANVIVSGFANRPGAISFDRPTTQTRPLRRRAE